MFIDEILQNRRALRVYPRPGLIRFDQTATQSVASVAADNLNETQQKTLVLHLAKQFGKETTIHGLNHVFAGSESKAKRFVWTLSFLMALVCLVYVCLYLAHRYNQRTFKTTVETTSYPIYKISFPEITICNRNRLNWARLEVAKSHFLLPQHRHNEYEQLFTEVVALYDTLTISQMERFDQFARRPLAALNYINFTSVVGLLAWHCDELLTDCTWRQQQKNCCDIFIPRYSQQGLCWAFNSVESAQGALKQFLDSKWPWRANTQGAGNGLTVRVLMNEQKHSPFSRNEIKGLTFMAVQPNVWNSYRTEVGSNVKANIRFTASLSFYDEQTRSLHSRVRKCVFPDERNSDHFRSLQGHIYMRENCQSECQQEHLMRYCNCTIDLFYPPGPYPACKLVDLPCVAKYSRRLVNFELNGEEQFVAQKRRGIVCQCYRNCRSLRYLTEVRTQPLPPEERLANDSLVDMDFYFLFNTITVYKTSLIYTWVDLMVSFGGITALFLGCSLISIVELVYFFFVDVPQQVRVKRHKSKKRTKRTELVESAYESVDTASKRKTGMILKY